MAKQPIILGNWKMYKTGPEAEQFVKQLIPMVEDAKTKIGLAVPFTSISSAASVAKGTNILIGAQNMNDAEEGAFTGEIAGAMLKDAGAHFVILGHSERRQIFQETNAFVNAKLHRALDEELTPVLCIGETEEERKKGHEEILEDQLIESLAGLEKEDAGRIIVAYEPCWAIGTGKTATPKQAQDTHKHVRAILSDLFGKVRAGKIPILYGGSVKPENAKTLLKQKDINGALVGGASLHPKSFAKIVNLED